MPVAGTVREKPAPSRRAVVGTGRVLLWNGGSIWIGRTGRIQTHAHHAIQISIALEADFLIAGASQHGGHRTSGAVVLPNRRHTFDGEDHLVAMFFVEPETTHGRALLAHYGSADISLLHATDIQTTASKLRAMLGAHSDDALLIAASQGAIAGLAGPMRPIDQVDSRISKAIEWMRARLDTSISLDDAAAVVHLSASRFRHLFVAQTGASFRAWLLWTRLTHAMNAGMGGQSWTVAAQEAGFADSSHFSRTCRRMFGLSPAMLARE